MLDRLRGRSSDLLPEVTSVTVTATVYSGDEDLEVVGESHYQPALWSLCGGPSRDRVRHDVLAVLVPEPQNPHDENAISVHIDGHVVGYLDRETAALLRPGVARLMNDGAHVALRGVIVGGGQRGDGIGMLGVWLDHDPTDFGLESTRRARRVGPSIRATPDIGGSMRTGFTEAWLTDAEDDSYDLSWFNELPDGDRAAIATLRSLLEADPDPIDRHFQFAELECRLYRCRDLFETALAEFDEVCAAHDREMEAICAAFRAKWGKVPLLETYRQMAIRTQKQRDWEACIAWTGRGLALYGDDAAREDAVEDLIKRLNRAQAKLEAPSAPRTRAMKPVTTSVAGNPARAAPDVIARRPDVEILVCSLCEGRFERLVVRGRKPRLCPPCRTAA